jgi:serine/threonine-protein kinase
LTGTILDGRYRVAELIGIGGMGRVYRAEQVNVHGRDVAIKLLSSAVAGTAVVSQRFENEARIIAQLRHPNTLKMIDSGRFPDGRLYIVTEFLAGCPLEELYTDEPLTMRRTINIMKQVCSSLSEAHDLGIIHRDLKPSNIFVEPVAGQDVVKVLDFGLAKLIDVPGFTAPANICGTPGFMAPEQIAGQRIDHRCDIYALGTIIYECLSGQPPFTEESVHALMMTHLKEAPVPLSRRALLEPIDVELEALVMRMLEKLPDDRPQSTLEVQRVLEDIERRLLSHESRASRSPLPQETTGDTEAETADLTPVRSRPAPDESVLRRTPETPSTPREAIRDLPRETPVLSSGSHPRANGEHDASELRTLLQDSAPSPIARRSFDDRTARLDQRRIADDGLITVNDPSPPKRKREEHDPGAPNTEPVSPANIPMRLVIDPADTQPSQRSIARMSAIPAASTDPTALDSPPAVDLDTLPKAIISSPDEVTFQPGVNGSGRKSAASPLRWIVIGLCALAFILAAAAVFVSLR